MTLCSDTGLSVRLFDIANDDCTKPAKGGSGEDECPKASSAGANWHGFSERLVSALRYFGVRAHAKSTRVAAVRQAEPRPVRRHDPASRWRTCAGRVDGTAPHPTA